MPLPNFHPVTWDTFWPALIGCAGTIHHSRPPHGLQGYLLSDEEYTKFNGEKWKPLVLPEGDCTSQHLWLAYDKWSLEQQAIQALKIELLGAVEKEYLMDVPNHDPTMGVAFVSLAVIVRYRRSPATGHRGDATPTNIWGGASPLGHFAPTARSALPAPRST